MEKNQKLGDRYVIGEQLGAGATGSVYLADDTLFLKPVVIKVLHPNLAIQERIRARFKTEALIQGNLAHTNIVRATDFFEDTERRLLAIVMDFVDGPDLELHLVEEMGGRLTLPRICSIMLPVMDGVHFAHSKGVVHRDLKPANIMLERGDGLEIPKVTDFSIAKILGDANSRTLTGAVIGTPAFMPPEQLRGAKDIDHRVDVYALGTILYQLATGRLPFGDDTEYEITHKVLSGVRPDPPSTVAPALGHRFDALIDRAMHPDRSMRYQNVDDLQRDLAALIDEDHNASTSTSAPPLKPSTMTPPAQQAPSTGKMTPNDGPTGRPQAPPSEALNADLKPDPRNATAPLSAQGAQPPTKVEGHLKIHLIGVAALVFLGSAAITIFFTVFIIAPRLFYKRDAPDPAPPGSIERPAPLPTPAEQTFADAEAAYRRHVSAFNERNEEAYIDGFRDPVGCWYGSFNVSHSKIRGDYQRWYADNDTTLDIERIVHVKTPNSAEAHLRVFGQDVKLRGANREHQKYIVLKKQDGVWKLDLEIGVHSRFPCGVETFE